MILVIRISGMPEVDRDVDEALFRLRLRRKYSAVLLKETPENIKLLTKIRNFIAYGSISKETLSDILVKRGFLNNKKINKTEVERVAEQLEQKKPEEIGVKPFFRLHPPRGGIESKKHFGVGKGVLGDHKDKIKDLVRRML